MTWENLTADADALRQRLGFDKWAVLGHSFGGQVALEYALRYPDSLSHLVLLDTGGDSRWAQENAPEILAKRGYGPRTVKLVRRFFNGQIAPNEMVPALMRFGSAYYHHPSILLLAREMIRGEWRAKTRPEALIFGGRQLLKSRYQNELFGLTGQNQGCVRSTGLEALWTGARSRTSYGNDSSRCCPRGHVGAAGPAASPWMTGPASTGSCSCSRPASAGIDCPSSWGTARG
jgi:pimeloyl-ACP methyl ester carboxylesterase